MKITLTTLFLIFVSGFMAYYAEGKTELFALWLGTMSFVSGFGAMIVLLVYFHTLTKKDE